MHLLFRHFCLIMAALEHPFTSDFVWVIGAAGRVLGPYIMGKLYDLGGLPPVLWLAFDVAVLSILFFILHSWLNRSRRDLDAFEAAAPKVDTSVLKSQ